MAVADLVNLSALIEDAKCFALVRQHRWPEGIHCPACGSNTVVRDGFDESQVHRQRYRCKGCTGRFDDLTGTVLAGHHQPLRVWVLCLYFMGLNLSNRQIAQELGLDGSDVQAMTEQLRRGLVDRALRPPSSCRPGQQIGTGPKGGDSRPGHDAFDQLVAIENILVEQHRAGLLDKTKG